MTQDLAAIAATTGWEIRRLSDVIHIAQYGLSSRGEPVGDIPILRMNCQKRGRVVFDDLQYINARTRGVSSFLLAPGDLLFNRTNSLEHVGRTAIFDGGLSAVFASYLIRIRVDENVVAPEYLNYYLNWPSTQRMLKGLASRGVSQSNISASKLKDLNVLLPPLEQQRSIAQLLRGVDELLDVEERRLNALVELWSATLQRFFATGLAGAGETDTRTGEKPAGWTTVPLSSIASLVSGGTPPKADPSLWEGNVPWISPKDMKTRILKRVADHITDAAASTYSRVVPAGSLLVVIRGMILAREIPVCLVERPVAFNQDVKAVIPGRDVEPLFLLYAVLARRSALEAAIGTSAHGTRRIGTATLEQLLIPIPSRDEQRQIGTVLRAIDDHIEIARQKVTFLAELSESLRTNLLTGSLPVQSFITNDGDANDANRQRI